MPAKGDGITKRKDGRYVGRVVVQTPEGPKRKQVYGRKYKEVVTKLNALRADADRGVVFDANELRTGEWLDSWLSDCQLLGLKWADVDLDAESPRLSVRRALKPTEKGPAFGPPKNKASRRAVPLNGTAVAALRAHGTRQGAERLASPVWRDPDLVFPNRVGGPMDHNNLYYRDYKPLLKSAGLGGEGFTFHSLRHTFATALFARGEHPKVVQSLLGHSSITQTMDTYSHLMEGMGGDAVGGLDDAFG